MKELNEFILSVNDTKVDYPSNKSIVELFEDQVYKSSDEIAVTTTEEKITYAQLNVRANQIAQILLDHQVDKEAFVGIIAERKIETIIAMVGILKSGAAYLPIDPSYPNERIKFMLEDSNCSTLFVYEQITLEKTASSLSIINLSDLPVCNNSENLTIPIGANNLAYLMYTSGTTGNPKGVMIEHKNVIRLVKNTNYADFNQIRMLQVGSLSFDAATFEIWGPLLNGGYIHLLEREVLTDVERLKETIIKEGINTMWLTAALYNELIDLDVSIFDGLKQLYIGGEAASVPHVKRLLAHHKNIAFYNGYGPTETTTFSHHYQMKLNCIGTSVPIGKPLSNTVAYIMHEGKLCDIGEIGELFIGGDGVGRGYLNSQQLTNEKFINNPFGKPHNSYGGGRLYRTGDLVKWLPDGNVEYVGRTDDQVKIRGFRIELGEVENKLKQLSTINNAVALVKETEASKILCGYVTSKEELDIEKVKEELRQLLPDYMIPTYLIQVEFIPRTKNDKVDKRVLLEIELETEGTRIAPRNDKEKVVFDIFKEILGFSDMGIQANFYELGGDSIKAIRMVSKLRNQGYQANLEDIMTFKTVERIAQSLNKIEAHHVLDQSEVVGEVLLTPIQKQFFASNLVEPHHFNQSALFVCRTNIVLDALEQTLNKIMLHHDMLRAIYQNEKQIIPPLGENSFTIEHFKNADQAFIKEKGDEIQATLDLSTGPLVKAVVFEAADADYLLLIIHHLMVDGISWRIISEDLNFCYEAALANKELILPEKTLSFQKWSVALKESREGYHLKKELPFWKQTEAIIEESHFPLQPASQPNGLSRQSFTLGVELTKQLLYQSCLAYGLEINDLLLAALFGAMHQVTQKTSLSVFMEGHGREKIDGDWLPIDRTVGWFTTIYPLAVRGIGSKIEENICLVKEAFRKIPNHGLGYTVLKSYGEPVLTGVRPIVTFNYLGNFTNEVGSHSLKMLDIDHGVQESKKNRFASPIVVDGAVMDGQLRMFFAFDTEKFHEDFITELREAYFESLSQMINHCVQKKEVVYTPSDFNETAWSIKEFTAVKKYYEQKGQNLERILPLTPLQSGMLYHKLADSESSQYVVQQTFKINGNFNVDLLKQSFALLVQKYRMLRTNIVYKNVSEPRQVIMQTESIEFNYHDLSCHQDAADQLEKMKLADRARGFDLEEDHLIRMTVSQLSKNQASIYLTFHHIIMDAWCLSKLERDLLGFYEKLINDEEVTDREEIYKYETFINFITDKDHEESIRYWQELLFDYEGEKADIPTLETSELQDVDGVDVLKVQLSPEETKALETISGKYDTTLNTIIEAVWGIVLQNYNNQQDVVFGKVVSGRGIGIAGIEEMVGLFINTIPVRVTVTEGLTFTQLIKNLQEQAIKSSVYDNSSLAEIGSSVNHPDLISSLVNFENYYQEAAEGAVHLDLELVEIVESTNYGINLSIKKHEALQLELMYQVKSYGPSQIRLVLDQLVQVLRQVINNPEILVTRIELLDEAQTIKITKNFNQTTMAYEREKNIIALFEEQVSKVPHKTAIKIENQKLSFSELDDQATKRAVELRNLGVKANDIVAIMADKSLEMFIGIFAILKAGGAYLPLDPELPKERLSYMIEDSNAKAIMIAPMKELNPHLELLRIPKIKFTRLEKISFSVQEKKLENVNKSDSLAYVIYTSGTTGKPKGVMVEHRNVLNLAQWQSENGHYSESTVVLQNFNYVFDGSVWEIFPALLSGCTLELVPEESRHDPEKLLKLIPNKQVTMIPSLFRALVDYAEENDLTNQLHAFDKLYMAAEAVPYDLIERYKKMPGNNIGNVFNAYGPTETTVCATCYQMDQDHDRVLIGKPIGNMEAYILAENKLCGVGMTGELCVGGDGVARGYLNRPELTKEKFVDHPYEEGKLYRTGDLARWMPDGNIEYLGRIDEQVKIRGFRIELGEIETVLRKVEGVTDAVVVVKNDTKQEKTIHAYYVAKHELDIDYVKDELRRGLPEYMVPLYMRQIESIPLTKTGKINKRELPEIELKNDVNYVAPRTEKEAVVCRIFSEVLAIEKVGMRNNFFELGGDSIKAIRIVSKMREAGYRISVKDIMGKHTIERITKMAMEEAENSYEQDEVKGSIISTPIVEAFKAWNLAKPYHFNQSLMIDIAYDASLVKNVLDALVVHHDMLRAVYRNHTLEVFGSEESKLYDFNVYDLSGEGYVEKSIEKVCAQIQASIDLENGPLVKVAMFKTDVAQYLMICIHHLVIDNISWQILLDDFFVACGQLEKGMEITLPKKTASFQEWSQLLDEFRRSEQLKKEKDYWELVVAEIDSGKVKSDNDATQIGYDEINIYFEKEETKQLLYEAGNAYQTEINDLLLSAMSAAVRKLTGQTVVSIGLEGHGREELHRPIEIDRTVGWFTTIYPVVVKCFDDMEQCIITTKEMLRAIPNRGIGYGLLMGDNEAKPELYFNYLGEISEDSEGQGTKNILNSSTDLNISKDNKLLGTISFNGGITQEKLFFRLTYDKSKYSEKKMNQFANLYKEALSQIIEHCSAQETSIKTLSDYGDQNLMETEFSELMDMFDE